MQRWAAQEAAGCDIPEAATRFLLDRTYRRDHQRRRVIDAELAALSCPGDVRDNGVGIPPTNA